MRIPTLAIVGLTFASSFYLPLPQARADELPVLNRSVVQFARRNLGRRVGDGQCATLPREALRRAGAYLPNYDRRAWGRLIRKRVNVLPGDIIWFEGVRFETEGGSYSSMPHHFAIVDKVLGNGEFVIIQQNYGNKPSELDVRRDTINMGDLKKGTVRFYRPTREEP